VKFGPQPQERERQATKLEVRILNVRPDGVDVGIGGQIIALTNEAFTVAERMANITA
jgi:hypothetical protein